MSLSLRMLYDAVFSTPETYQQLYVAPQKKSLASVSVEWKKNTTEGELENRLLISGGKKTPRLRVLSGVIAEQLKEGRAVVVIEPTGTLSETANTYFLQDELSPIDGSYDPFYGHSINDIVDMLIEGAMAEGISAAEAADLVQAIADEIDYLAATQHTPHLSGFVYTSSRELGMSAFSQGNDQLPDSHSDRTVSARLDRLRLSLRRFYQVSTLGMSISSSVSPGRVTVLKLPQNVPSWMAFALHELNTLQVESDFEIFTVFEGIYISEKCRSQLEALPGGRCFCYQDLPAIGWLWSIATAASSAGCLLKHTGLSAQIVSDCFGKKRVTKVTRTTSSGRSSCDSGGFMGIFGSNTLSSSHSCTISYEWEPAIPDGAIRELDDDEGIFFYENMNKPYRINI